MTKSIPATSDLTHPSGVTNENLPAGCIRRPAGTGLLPVHPDMMIVASTVISTRLIAANSNPRSCLTFAVGVHVLGRSWTPP